MLAVGGLVDLQIRIQRKDVCRDDAFEKHGAHLSKTIAQSIHQKLGCRASDVKSRCRGPPDREGDIGVTEPAEPDRPALRGEWDRFLQAAERERRAGEGRPEGVFPHYSEDGSWRLLAVDELSTWRGEVYDHGNWTAGFWYGVMWLLALGAGDARAKELTRGRLPRLVPRSTDSTTHDLGFLFYPSLVLGGELGFVDPGEAAAVQAANTLTARLNAQGGYLQAFGPIGDPRSAGTSTIDTMMNLPLLWWARERGADVHLGNAARWHARTSARLYVRDDGSTYHLLRFDPVSGALRHQGTFQGAADDSCWSRGQAWGICGFAWAYAATGEPEFCRAAERCASYFFDRLPDDAVAPWDFGDPSPTPTRDASATAIACLGALLLGHVHPEADRRGRWRRTGLDALERIGDACLNTDPATQGILLHSCYSKPHGLGVDGATAWGDFFFGLALALAVDAIPLRTVLGFRPPR
ncbi:MAG: glycosyl hydrolase [Streptosporangiales bacterium]|nr:glycosyl hydrolase [Streptosporangiales bacterium]